jgi:hypothetical protein
MDYDPLPMSIYDKGSKHGKGKGKSQGLALSHLFSPLGAVTMLFALAVWGTSHRDLSSLRNPGV